MEAIKEKKSKGSSLYKEEALLLSAIKWNFEAYAAKKEVVTDAGLCMNCNRRSNCVWQDQETLFCEHYQ
ncbi:hypothetical protein ACRASX_01185 [Flavobacterium sp. TMP13]|uniref:hypothetical protein n=1 Tax=unclassified Flavobacterium TaxID=196869 RepID=UPI00076CC94B|nr:hypothetical protein [Flavobacterium sp. TAB 87]KVV14182.1 hypothetical protein AP058_02068 [Flavobacterium sp. TAB 87]